MNDTGVTIKPVAVVLVDVKKELKSEAIIKAAIKENNTDNSFETIETENKTIYESSSEKTEIVCEPEINSPDKQRDFNGKFSTLF
jgi:hypothetical protein